MQLRLNLPICNYLGCLPELSSSQEPKLYISLSYQCQNHVIGILLARVQPSFVGLHKQTNLEQNAESS